MGIRRTILRPVAYFAGRHAAKQCRAFMNAHQRTERLQEELLRKMVRLSAATAFGRDHGFSSIRSYEDFKRAVPVGSYRTLYPYVRRVLAGETAALLPPGEKLMMFSLTSGTTGAPKYIPVTGRFLAAMRAGWNITGLMALRDHREAWLRPILQIASPMCETKSPTGLPCGAISGLLAATQKKIVRRMYPVPQAVQAIEAPAVKFYSILRCAIESDVSIITTANPSTTVKLVEIAQANAEQLIRDVADGEIRPPGGLPAAVASAMKFKPNRRLARRLTEAIARDGKLLPRHFWRPVLLMNWTGGTLKLYLSRLRELFGDVPVRDIGLLASEGRFSVPLRDGTAEGVAEITSNFLEFIPAEEHDAAEANLLRAHELAAGREYFLVVTNWAGLWRYNLDDRVRVTGFLGRSPIFEFLSRGTHTANITGEKITEHQVVEAMRRACAAAGANVDRFVVQGRFARTPYYELRLEQAGDVAPEKLAALMDESLAKLNIEYRSKRSSGRLGPVRPVTLPAGTLRKADADEIDRRRGRSEQYKHRYLLTDVLEGGRQGGCEA
ncbi:MAG: GH3 auxin-responsive promoter family protein [Planctomycetota bacterium]